MLVLIQSLNLRILRIFKFNSKSLLEWFSPALLIKAKRKRILMFTRFTRTKLIGTSPVHTLEIRYSENKTKVYLPLSV